ncbi:hypothetical protein WSS_A38241 [Rhodococcus opacus M213]|uniref:Uncharacterized protein n=1 Tax=Rhodococcus opacus M213 TaxID=1129896 RepID=K8X6X3_RHOOP|nr:hypothetical protein WSS_A38241 [Rhodococcus opacus M213]
MPTGASVLLDQFVQFNRAETRKISTSDKFQDCVVDAVSCRMKSGVHSQRGNLTDLAGGLLVTHDGSISI